MMVNKKAVPQKIAINTFKELLFLATLAVFRQHPLRFTRVLREFLCFCHLFFFAKHIVCCIQSIQSEKISLDPLNYISNTSLRVISDISKFNLTPWRLEYVKINHTLKLGNGIKKQFTFVH